MPDNIRLAVLGAGGRMGRALIAAALDDARFEIASVHARRGSGHVGIDAGTLAGRAACGINVSDDLDGAIAAADVAIEFTRPESTVIAAAACSRAGCALVSGTTGMDAVHSRAMEAAAKTIPVFWAPNMSIGVNLLLAALAEIAARLGEEYDAEVVEAHHRHKVDAPSGTAIALGEMIAAARGRSLEELADYGRAGTAPRAAGHIGFHSLRAGEIVGEHDVRFVSAGEEIRLGHSAYSRKAFADGALRAAAWLRGRTPGLYGMRELLESATATG